MAIYRYNTNDRILHNYMEYASVTHRYRYICVYICIYIGSLIDKDALNVVLIAV